ncbi:MAG TPA: PEP-CTERM sorting domain-containing protein [Aquabacterium sp.]|uniref:PEP-CTERM sorting domain-containing protein n=1 Tax=Aquabacterium sp. TaxID=1872578 RepID=UPI002E321651|nr:PEP-CTERM sorting domain-containing protein [Aquabacterium sp.]HEX5357286.1 PEP-CTERM sorting domain-containing protein [Aquabacterium sp.]
MKLQTIVAALALAATGAANASLNGMDTGTSSSVAFIAQDTVGGTQGSVFVDLGFSFADFMPASQGGPANLSAVNNTVVWNFANNTITRNGVAVNATNDFSAVAPFFASAGADAKWGVIAGDTVGVDFMTRYLTTGTPTPANLTNQGDSSALQLVAPLWDLTGAAITSSADNGSYYASSNTDPAWTGSNATGIGTLGKWQNNITWNALTAGTQTNFVFANGDGTEEFVGAAPVGSTTTGLLNARGTFTYSAAAQTLTWQTATVTVMPSVPEPSTYGLGLVALAIMGLTARRKAK